MHDLGLWREVQLLGFVTGALKLSLCQGAQVFALPTHHENFGLALIEALGCGTPLVTTRGVDIASELQQSGAVSLVERHPVAFADALEKSISHAEQRESAGQSARAWLFRQFDEAPVMQQMLALYLPHFIASEQLSTKS